LAAAVVALRDAGLIAVKVIMGASQFQVSFL
jgi:hypothetical protein